MEYLDVEQPMKIGVFGWGDLVNKSFEHLMPEKYENLEVVSTFNDKNLYEKFINSALQKHGISSIRRIYWPAEKIISIFDLNSRMKEMKQAIEEVDVAVFIFDLEDRDSVDQVCLINKMCVEKNILAVGTAIVPDYRVSAEKQAAVLSKINRLKNKFDTLIILECEKLKNDLEQDNHILNEDFISHCLQYLFEALWDLFDTLSYSNTKEDIGQFLKGNKTAYLSIVEAEGEEKFNDMVKMLLRNKYSGINKLKTKKLLSTIVIDSESTVEEVNKVLEEISYEVQNIDIIFSVMQEEGKEDFVKFIALAIN